MNTNTTSIEKRRKKLKEKREELESTQMNAVRDLLPNDTIENICSGANYNHRRRLITPVVTVFHMIGAALSRERSFQSAWHMMGETGHSGVLTRARSRLPLDVWEGIDAWTVQEMEQNYGKENTWRSHRLLGIDGTGISMAGNEELLNHFGKGKGRYRDSACPLGRVEFVFNLKTMGLISHKMAPWIISENALFRDMQYKLKKGDIIVGDRRSSGSSLYAEYKLEGLEFITRAHQSLKVDKLKVLERYSKDDTIVELKLDWKHRKKNKKLPMAITVRFIRIHCKIRGIKRSFWVVTSLLDKRQYPAQEIKDIYKKRWKLEGLIHEIKIWLGAEALRSKTVEGIYKELYARAVAYNLVHWLLLNGAKKHRKEPDRLSVLATIRLVVTYSLKMSTAPFWKLPHLYEELLEKVAASYVRYRPNRIEPRMRRRVLKAYSILRTSRAEWRKAHGIAA